MASDSEVPTSVDDWHYLNQHILRGNISKVEEWLSHHSPNPYFFDVPRPNVRNPLCTAAEHNQKDILVLLMKHGFSSKTADIRNYRDGPLHLAAYKGHHEVVQTLVEDFNGDVDSWSNGYCPLQRAIVGNNTQVVQYLLDKGANPNLLYPVRGHSCPLEFETVTCLQKRKYLKHILNDSFLEAEGHSMKDFLLNVAIENGQSDIIKLLLRAGAKYSHAAGYFVECLCSKRVPPFNVTMFVLAMNTPALRKNPWLWKHDAYVTSPLTYAVKYGNVVPVELILEAGWKVSRGILENDDIFEDPHGGMTKALLSKYVSNPYSLQNSCLFTLRDILGLVTERNVQSLPLPRLLQCYIRLDHLRNKYRLKYEHSD